MSKEVKKYRCKTCGQIITVPVVKKKVSPVKKAKKRGRKRLLSEEDKVDVDRLYYFEKCPNGSPYTLDKLARLYRVSETTIAMALKERGEVRSTPR